MDRKYEKHFLRFLKGPGDQLNANVAGPAVWRVDAPGYFNVRLTSLRIIVGDTGSYNELNYGALPQLANGVHFGLYSIETTELVLDLMSNEPGDKTGVRSNIGWDIHGYDAHLMNEGQGGNTRVYVNAMYDFDKIGNPLLNYQVYLGATIQDDLSGLDHHYFSVKGIVV